MITSVKKLNDNAGEMGEAGISALRLKGVRGRPKWMRLVMLQSRH